MANKHRGEIDAELDGKAFRLCLTLGALADLESAFGATDLLDLASRFEKGRIAAREIRAIIGAGLRGAGYEVSDDDVNAMQTDNGVAGFIDIVARLLSATFGTQKVATDKREDAGDIVPFPGKT